MQSKRLIKFKERQNNVGSIKIVPSTIANISMILQQATLLMRRKNYKKWKRSRKNKRKNKNRELKCKKGIRKLTLRLTVSSTNWQT